MLWIISPSGHPDCISTKPSFEGSRQKCTHHARRKKLRRQVSKPGEAEAPDLGPVVDGNFRFIFLVGIELTQNVDKVLLETIQWQT